MGAVEELTLRYLRRAKAAFDRQGIDMPLPRLKLVRPEIFADV